MNEGDRGMSRGFSSMVRAFRYRNYALFFSGQGISIIGTWMQQLAMTWLVYRLTSSTLLLGVISFTGMVPIFLFSPLAGVFADRHDRYRIVIATNTLAMLQAFLAAFLTLAGIITLWQIFCLSAFLGTLNALEMPARQSLVIDIVENRDDLSNAIALNSFMFNGGRIIGPSFAGLFIGLFGEGVCFLINGLSFLFILSALLAMDIVRRHGAGVRARIIRGLLAGYGYAYRTTSIRTVLVHLAVISFLSMPYVVLMPYYARDFLHGGPDTLGILMGASGCGAIVGTLYLAARSSLRGLAWLIALATLVSGAGILAFAFSRIFPLSLALLFFVGSGLIVQMASCNTIIQTIVREDMRGRVMSLFAMAFAGVAPFGSLSGGVLSGYIGPQATLAVFGTVIVAQAVFFTTRARAVETALGELNRQG